MDMCFIILHWCQEKGCFDDHTEGMDEDTKNSSVNVPNVVSDGLLTNAFYILVVSDGMF